MPVNNTLSYSIWAVVLANWAGRLVHNSSQALQKRDGLPYNGFRTLVAAGNVAEARSLMGH